MAELVQFVAPVGSGALRWLVRWFAPTVADLLPTSALKRSLRKREPAALTPTRVGFYQGRRRNAMRTAA